MLGCDFEPGEGFYRISHIVPGVSWDPSDRSPLTEPGCPIQVGDYLIAIDGVEIPVGENVFAQLVDKADKWVTLSYNDRPRAQGARTWRVKTLHSESAIRYREWVEANRAKVDAWSGGRIGYLHLPDMGESGLREFGRYWYPQTGKQAIIIDDRYNAGGFTGDMIIDRLERRLWGITTPREGGFGDNPERVLNGPLLVLVNEDTGSNGEYFATAIQLKGLAPIVGMRTWGGAVGIEPHQDLVDGGTVTPPQFGIFGLDGTWLIEGIGVVPDVEVQNMPASVVAGQDTQLRTGVDLLLQELEEDGANWAVPPRPDFPDKSKPGAQ
jgi:tricorn protease